MHIKQLTPTQLKQTTAHGFANPNARAISVSAAIIHYENIHNNLTFMQKLTVAHNIELLETALVRLRNCNKFDPELYATLLSAMRKNPAILLEQAYAIIPATEDLRPL